MVAESPPLRERKMSREQLVDPYRGQTLIVSQVHPEPNLSDLRTKNSAPDCRVVHHGSMDFIHCGTVEYDSSPIGVPIILPCIRRAGKVSRVALVHRDCMVARRRR